MRLAHHLVGLIVHTEVLAPSITRMTVLFSVVSREPFACAIPLQEAMMGSAGHAATAGSAVQRQRPLLYTHDESSSCTGTDQATVLRDRCHKVSLQIAEAIAFCHSRSIILQGIAPGHSIWTSPNEDFETKLVVDWTLARTGVVSTRPVPIIAARSEQKAWLYDPPSPSCASRSELQVPWLEHAPHTYRSPESARHSDNLIMRKDDGALSSRPSSAVQDLVDIHTKCDDDCGAYSYTPVVTPATSDNYAWALVTLQMHEFGRCWDSGKGENGICAFENYLKKKRDVGLMSTDDLAAWAASVERTEWRGGRLNSFRPLRRSEDEGLPMPHGIEDRGAVCADTIVRRSRLCGSRIVQLSTIQKLVKEFPMNTAGTGGASIRLLWQQIRGGLQRITMSPCLERACGSCLAPEYSSRPCTMADVVDMIQIETLGVDGVEGSRGTVESLHVAQTLVRLGEALESRGTSLGNGGVKTQYQAATEVAPHSLEAWRNLARIQYTLREFSFAAESYKKLSELVPQRQRSGILELIDDCRRKHRFWGDAGGVPTTTAVVADTRSSGQGAKISTMRQGSSRKRIACASSKSEPTLPPANSSSTRPRAISFEKSEATGSSPLTPVRPRGVSDPPVRERASSFKALVHLAFRPSNIDATAPQQRLSAANEGDPQLQVKRRDSLSGMLIIKDEDGRPVLDGNMRGDSALAGLCIAFVADEEPTSPNVAIRARTPSTRQKRVPFPDNSNSELPPLDHDPQNDALSPPKTKPQQVHSKLPQLDSSLDSSNSRTLLKQLSAKLGFVAEKVGSSARNLLLDSSQRRSGSSSRLL